MAEGHWITVSGHPVYIDRKGRRATTSLKQMTRQAEDRAAARERSERAATYYAVFPHSEDRKPTGRGHVTRPTDAEGRPHDQRNYGGVAHVGKVYRRRSDADRALDRMS